MKCPYCGGVIEVPAGLAGGGGGGVAEAARLLGARRSAQKAAAARLNGRKGGWPKGRVRGPRKATE